MILSYKIHNVAPYINWIYFFHAWGFQPRFAAIANIHGCDVCRRLKAQPVTAAIPVLMLTAKVEDSDKITGLTIGADDYITKPFNPLELIARVKAQLRRYTRYKTAYLLGQCPEHGLLGEHRGADGLQLVGLVVQHL